MVYYVACYARLSREDGDKPESDSIMNQQRIIQDYCTGHKEFIIKDHYADDGYTGTNFDRPAFRQLIRDIENGCINCVVVKDLSRFGRDYIDMGFYLERYFPMKNVRFIAINDNVDSLNGPYDMLLPLKNVFNTQYARDISEKVRSAFKTKQKRGEFVGAFASYGYLKDPENHNHLVVDPVAAQVVRRIFQMAADGVGQLRIAKLLNEESIPCPSEYKHLMGLKYHNNRRLDATKYWTYATIHRILKNEMYIGNMVQAKNTRSTMHGKAQVADKGEWIIVPHTHEAIVPRALWDVVQSQVASRAKAVDFAGNVGLFAGFLKCGDCGRAMTKTTWNGRITYTCGSYHRYGANACSSHYIGQEKLTKILLNDLNRMIAAVEDLQGIAEKCVQQQKHERKDSEKASLTTALQRVQYLKQSAYEDFRDCLLSKDEYVRYKADYDRQEESLVRQLQYVQQQQEQMPAVRETPWRASLLQNGKLTVLDRMTLSQTVKEICVYEKKRIRIVYLFSKDLQELIES